MFYIFALPYASSQLVIAKTTNSLWCAGWTGQFAVCRLWLAIHSLQTANCPW